MKNRQWYISEPVPCLSKDEDAVQFVQFYQHFPWIEPFYTSIEKDFSAKPYVLFSQNTWPWLPSLIVCCYLFMIYCGPIWMSSRHAYELKIPLAVWNLCLCLFSTCGMIRTVPHFLHNITTMSFRHTICTHPKVTYGDGACGLWVMLFIFSKVPELVDTLFIILRKRKLWFLHWYHHITVLLYCWYSFAHQSPAGLYFVSMNYTVHSAMYGYYYLQSIDKWPKQIPPSLITIAQISQMFVGTGICLMSMLYLTDGEACDVGTGNVVAGALMYGSYLYLFVDFFVSRFLFKSKSV